MIQKIIKLKDRLINNPKGVFLTMLAFIIISLANFVIRAAKPKNKSRENIPYKVDGKNNFDMGFSSLIDETMLLKDTYRMKKSIDSLLAKEKLTDKDSLLLMQNLQELQTITNIKLK